MYVTLEPCAHQGRQPPCADAILDGRHRAGGDRLRRPEREGERPRARGSCATAGVEVEFVDGAEADRGAAPQPGLPQARAHRPAAGRPQVGDHASTAARRPRGGDSQVDLRRREPRAGPPLARRGRRRRGRDRHRARRRPAADRPRGRTTLRQPARVVFDSEARLPLDSRARRDDRRGAARRRRRRRRRPPSASTALRDAGAEVIVLGGDRAARVAAGARASSGSRGIT